MDDRLIVALDTETVKSALGIVEQTAEVVGFYKIGLGLLPQGGFDLARRLKKGYGKRVFLDLKLFDIGTTVGRAIKGLAAVDPDFITVHGDPDVVSAAAESRSDNTTKILAVTFLTSMDRHDLDRALIRAGDFQQLVLERSARAFEAGADGVICSPREARPIRSIYESNGKIIVCPGIRPSGSAQEDQKRTLKPSEAIHAGADHIVVGRPIVRAANPRLATESILAELT